MWNLLFAVVLALIALCPNTPTWAAVPSMLAAMIVLIWPLNPIRPARRYTLDDYCAYAGSRGARGPASGRGRGGCSRCIEGAARILAGLPVMAVVPVRRGSLTVPSNRGGNLTVDSNRRGF